MNRTRQTIRVIALLSMVSSVFSLASQGQSPELIRQQSTFGSPEEGVKALVTATRAKDKPALEQIFGPSVQQMLTGDEAQDAANFDSFTEAVTEKCTPVPDGPNKLFLEIGPNKWPFPIPLVKQGNSWVFDTEAGKQEIICRHIGRDELHAIGLSRAYVEAQRQFAKRHAGSGGVPVYATGFKSLPTDQVSLARNSSAVSAPPLNVLLEEGESRGGMRNGGHGLTFYGYRFKILTRQGPEAPGGKLNYVVHGKMTRGFALVVYPTHWGKSGVMTFIINQDGKLFQRNLGEKTATIASAMVQYNPTEEWTPVDEPGVLDNEMTASNEGRLESDTAKER